MKLIIQFAKEHVVIVYQKHRGSKFTKHGSRFFHDNRVLSSATCPENAFSREDTFFVRGGNKQRDWDFLRISVYHKKVLAKLVQAYNETE